MALPYAQVQKIMASVDVVPTVAGTFVVVCDTGRIGEFDTDRQARQFRLDHILDLIDLQEKVTRESNEEA